MKLLRRGLLSALFSTGVVAEEPKPVELSPVQVTASRSAGSPFEAPQWLTLVHGEEIDEAGPQVMTQALAYQPGAFFQQSGPGQGIVIVRGLKGSEVLHLVDGMRLNNAFFRNSPSQYIALVDPRNIDRLELLRGPYGTLYGSDAMGGVVQVLTPEHRFGGDALEAKAGVSARHGTADRESSGRAWFAAGEKSISLSGGFSYADFGKRRLPDGGQSPDGRGGVTLAGRVNDTDYESYGYDLKALWSPGLHELMLSAQSFDIPHLQRYFQTVPGYGTAPPARAIAEFRADRRFWHARYRYGAALGFVHDLELHLARQVMNDDRLDRQQNNSRDQFDFNRSTLDGFTAAASTPLAGQRLRYGFEYYRDTVASRSYRETPPGSGTYSYPNGTSYFSPFPDGSHTDDLGVYLLDEWQLTAGTLLEGGLRYSRIDTHIAKGDRAFGADVSNDDVTGNLGMRIALDDGLAWSTNAGRGFRAPNLFDLAMVGQRAGNRVVVANLDLAPETVTTVDTGLKFQGGGASWQATFFYSHYDDRIATVNNAFAEGTPECPDDGVAATTGCAQNRNLAQTVYYGFEGGARYTFDTISLRASLNYTFGEQEQDGVRTPANRVPPLNGQFGVEWRASEHLSQEYWIFGAARQDRLDPNDLADTRINPDGTPSYLVANIRTVWTPAPGARLQLELRNVFDKAYREHGSGIDAPARGGVISAEWRWH